MNTGWLLWRGVLWSVRCGWEGGGCRLQIKHSVHIKISGVAPQIKRQHIKNSYKHLRPRIHSWQFSTQNSVFTSYSKKEGDHLLVVVHEIWETLSEDLFKCSTLTLRYLIRPLMEKIGDRLSKLSSDPGVVQEPASEMAKTWTPLTQRQLWLQQGRLRSPVQRADAALPRGLSGGLRLPVVQQLGRQSAKSISHQRLCLGPQHPTCAQSGQVWIKRVFKQTSF